jgi:hypothetical protein
MFEQWQTKFWEVVKEPDTAAGLKEAAMNERLGDWTETLTSVVVKTCESMGWQASAKGHKRSLLPIRRSEYLGLDVMAFANRDKGWRFPAAVFELENSLDADQIAYSLWKVLCVRAGLRTVFCYRRNPEERSALVSSLGKKVIRALDLSVRAELKGETLVVVGSRADSTTFPYGFFKWWRLDKNTGKFRLT